MSFQKSKTNSFGVGGRHRSAITNFYGNITNKGSKVKIDRWARCIFEKSIFVSDSTKQAEGLGEFFTILGKKGLNGSKKLAKNALKTPGRPLNFTAIIGSSLASGNTKAVLSTLPDVINFIIMVRDFISENLFKFLSS